MQLWVVADVKSEDGTVWELRGVYTSVELAEAACPTAWFCIMPVEANVSAPLQTTQCPGAYYPKAARSE